VKIEANAISVHCEMSGAPDGPWLICLHSLATNSNVWVSQLPALEAAFHVVRPDFRGHGQTQATPPPYSIDLLVADTVGTVLPFLEKGR
jgi:3-oxoadipate enol-lactonase